MKLINQMIRKSYANTKKELAYQGTFGDKRWYSFSQYGYELAGPFETKQEAEKWVLNYYNQRPHLILQWF